MSEQNPTPTTEAPKLSKKDLKKMEKKAQQAKAREEKAALDASKNTEEETSPNCGDRPLIRSEKLPEAARKFTAIGEINDSFDSKEVLLRARLHNSRGKGNLCFIVLRERFNTIQAVLSKNEFVNKAMLKFATSVPKESIVEVVGIVRKSQVPIPTTTQSSVEIDVRSLFVISRAAVGLPLQLEDASRSQELLDQQEKDLAAVDEKIKKLIGDAKEPYPAELTKQLEALHKEKSEVQKYVVVDQNTSLNNRIIDLRTPANQAIFTIQSGVCTLFREFLLSNGFTEIHTPKIMAGASEGGAQVFKLQYFDAPAFLAQSPQLPKQMAICADMNRVFEIAPVFRAENSLTHRHLTEFMGLDIEMAFHDHYHEVLDVIGNLFTFIFDGIANRFSKELEIISQQYKFEPLKYNKVPLRILYSEGVSLLRAAGHTIGDLDDINTTQEKALGVLVKEKYGVDFYIMDKFPKSARPFYTMVDPADPNYTNSYDLFVRGEEISSGSQRIHDPAMLEASAKAYGIDTSTIQSYIDAFKYGAPPHGGCGVGLERIVMLYLGLGNIRKTSMFPRDPRRLAP